MARLINLAVGLVIVGLLVSLGCWQLQRAQVKQHRLEAQQRLSQLSPTDITLATRELPAFLPVTLQGRYVNDQQIMLANQHNQGRLGYVIITPLQAGNEIVLIVRGWLASTPNTRSIPVVLPVLEDVVVQGSVYWPATKGWHLQQAIAENEGWPRIISRIDVAQIQAWFDLPVRPYVIRLASGDAHRFTQIWSPVHLSPQRHRGYAVQWFALALVAMIVLLIIDRRQLS